MIELSDELASVATCGRSAISFKRYGRKIRGMSTITAQVSAVQTAQNG
jgi:hypothetical protein